MQILWLPSLQKWESQGVLWEAELSDASPSRSWRLSKMLLCRDDYNKYTQHSHAVRTGDCCVPFPQALPAQGQPSSRGERSPPLHAPSPTPSATAASWFAPSVSQFGRAGLHLLHFPCGQSRVAVAAPSQFTRGPVLV